MPRLARLDAPGVLHHIIIRGIERRAIFRDDLAREKFLERLSILVPETQTICYACMGIYVQSCPFLAAQWTWWYCAFNAPTVDRTCGLI